jgi:PAS domain S-box-containing protein
MTDITDRKRAKEALQESEAKFRALAESSSSAIFLIQGTKYIYVNPAFESIIGYTIEDLADMNFWDFTHPDMRDLIRDRGLNRLKGQGPPSRYEIKFIAKNGQEKWVDYSTTVIDLENKPTILGSTYDITERKQAERSLKESEEKFAESFLKSPSPMAITAMKDGRYVEVNEAFAKVMGLQREELMDNTSTGTGYITAEQRVIFLDEYRQKGSVENLELQMRVKGGELRYGLFNSSKITIGEENFFLTQVTDITDRKQAEEEKRRLEERLQRAEKMEALGTLAGGVAHDLNNVLGVIVGYAELLLDEIDESNSIRPRLVNIMKGGERAAAIVQDLLTLARRGVPSKQILNLNKIIADCQRSPEFEKLSSYHSSVQIKTDCEPDLLNISGSSVHLAKTLFNLVSNASESMKTGGIVTIKTANQYLDKPIQGYDEVREGDYVVLSVSDTGEGIPAADLKRIFEPFYTKKVMGRSGTGLGLAVVWGTMKDHHGYINVESEEGKGNIFTLYFPVTREDISAERIAVAISEYMGKGESILVVDDVKGQRDLAAEMLQTLNYNVTTVSSGEEALAYLKEHQADLMVLDMIMDPGMDGLDTYRSVLEIHPKQKAIIVSGFSETNRVNAAQALGAGAYVRKPYVIEKLGLAVRNELERTI